MTPAVLLTLLTLCSSRVSLVTAAANPTKVSCKAGETVVFNVDKLDTIGLECPANSKLESPPAKAYPHKATVFMSADPKDTTKKEICEAVPGASCSAPSTDGRKCTVHIAQLPPSATVVYFRCKADDKDENKTCNIGLQIGPSHRLGPNTCAVQQGQIHLSVEHANEAAIFACGDGTTLRPTDKSKTFSEDCTGDAVLFEGATVAEEGGNYSLKVEMLPAETTKICYVCVDKATDSLADGCQVRISVSGADKGGAVSLGVGARTAAALGLTLVAFSFLRAPW